LQYFSSGYSFCVLIFFLNNRPIGLQLVRKKFLSTHFLASVFSVARNAKKKKGEDRPLVAKIQFKELLEHFLQVQAQHRESKRKNLAFNLSQHLRI